MNILGIKVENEKEILNIEIEQEHLKNMDMVMIYATMKNFIKKNNINLTTLTAFMIIP